MRMVESLHELYFPPYRLFPLDLLHFLLFVNFQGHFLIAGFVQTYPNNSIGSLSNLFSYYVIFQRVLSGKYNDLFLFLNLFILFRSVNILVDFQLLLSISLLILYVYFFTFPLVIFHKIIILNNLFLLNFFVSLPYRVQVFLNLIEIVRVTHRRRDLARHPP